MGLKTFNEESDKPWFISKKNPLVQHSWQIFEFKVDKEDYEPVGEYILVDTSEPIDITEKRVMNVLNILNRRSSHIDFNSLTNTRVLFSIVDDGSQSGILKAVFRTYDGKGVSIENAVLTIEKGVFNAKSVSQTRVVIN